MAPRKAALVPKWVTLSSDINLHRISPCSINGSPSYITTVAPQARALTLQFHIIQEVDV
jgi:hypothetical protein